MAQIIVEGAPRDTRGKNEARRLRVAGKVPATLYGGKGEALSLAVNTKQVTAILRSESGHNTLFQVNLGGKQEPAIVKDWQVDPVTGNLLHVDLLRIAMDVRMKVKVPVHTFGEPTGVKVQGGVYEVVLREVEVECLPADIPTEFRADVTGLALNQSLRAGDLPIDKAKHKLVTDPQSVVCSRRRFARRGREARGSRPLRVRFRPSPKLSRRARRKWKARKARKARRPARNRKRRSSSFRRFATCRTPCGSLSALAILARSISGRRITSVFWPWMKSRIALPFASSGPKVWRLSAWARWPGRKCILAKPQTYMNLSGVSVRNLLERYELGPEDLLVMFDERDLPWGMIRIAERGSRRNAQRGEVGHQCGWHAGICQIAIGLRARSSGQ